MTVFNRDTLGNGVRLLSAAMPNAQSVACFLGWAAGSRYESHETSGYAHFVEHMLFTGTERRPSMTALSAEVDSLGAIFNAATRKESTVYYAGCLVPLRPIEADSGNHCWLGSKTKLAKRK